MNAVPDLKLTRAAELPDPMRIARAESLPGLGPRILFFSGGSAMNDVARHLKTYTHNSVHLITPFDSGGSSQVLRQAFDMPAVGDLRSRLMALADETDLGQPDIFRLFTHRFPTGAVNADLSVEFGAIVRGDHQLMAAVSQPMRSLILRQLADFQAARPADFDFRGASIGNLILAGGYVGFGRELETVLFLMSKMVDVRGTVRTIVDQNLQIGAELSDGTQVHGQRNLTGKEVPPLHTPIARLFLAQGVQELPRESVRLPKRNRQLIKKADLICYPPGSLYSSVIANLLPARVGTSIAARRVPKVYVPSLGVDPECVGMDLHDQVGALLGVLRADAGADCPADRLISAVLCDAAQDDAAMAASIQTSFGIQLVTTKLCKAADMQRYAPKLLCRALISLC